MPSIAITRKGVFDQKGERIPVGTVLEVARIPEGWKNKFKVISEAKDAAQELRTGGAIETLRAEYQELTGEEADRRWGVQKLNSAIEEAKNG